MPAWEAQAAALLIAGPVMVFALAYAAVLAARIVRTELG